MDDMGERDYGQYRRDQIAVGHAYEKYILTAAANIGLTLHLRGVAGQKSGETRERVEIKRDGKWRTTGNLYIETAEKAEPRDGDYAPSGIYRDDNSQWYLIGDELTFWLFRKVTLQHLHQRKNYEKKQKPTSQAFVLPLKDANQYCCCKFAISKLGRHYILPNEPTQ